MAHVDWWVNDVALGEVGCDGVVVATPAGSTAYSLSAGGPVMNWGLEGFCVTFVAPHSLAARSLVLGRGHRVVIENASVDVDARLILDGQSQRHALGAGRAHRVGARGRAGAPRAPAGGVVPAALPRHVRALMLRELRVANLVLIREASLALAPGLNVLTGETGAGKTIVAQAVSLAARRPDRCRARRTSRLGGVRRGGVRRACRPS